MAGKAWWIGRVNVPSCRAAWTALCCLMACGDGIQVAPEVPLIAAPLATVEGVEVEAALIDPDAPTTTLEAPLEAWPLVFGAGEIAALDDAAFVGDALVVGGRNADRVVVMRYSRAVVDGVPTLTKTGSWARVRADASKLALVPIAGTVVVMWISDGHLEGLSVGATGELVQEPQRWSGEEGGQLEAPMVAAASGDEVVACAKDKLGPICFGWDAAMSLAGVNVISRKSAVGEPRALVPLDDGFMLVLGNCKSELCSRIDLAAVGLGRSGAPGKRRDLPLVQVDRGTAFIPDGDAMVLVARRVGAGEHSAWRVGASATRELDGRYSRVVGGFEHAGRTLLIERAHLKMRKGFPVRGYHVRALTEEKSARGRKHISREAIADSVADYLPTDADQTFSARSDALAFAAPARKGQFVATVIRLHDR